MYDTVCIKETAGHLSTGVPGLLSNR